MENQSVKTIHVNLLKVAVKSFSPADKLVVIEIYVDDGKIRRITRTAKLGDANMLAMQLIEELILSEKDQKLEFDGESLRDVEVIVQNEQKARIMLVDFFRTLHSKAQQIKNSKNSAGYMELIKHLQRTELTLYE